MNKSAIEINKMRRAGLYVWHALKIAEKLIRPGVTTGEVDAQIEKFFDDMKVIPLFKGYRSDKVPFPAVTCMSVNEEIVHGIPGSRKLVEGDIVGVDTGCKAGGWCGDAAVTFPVGKISEQKQRLLDVTKHVLQIAIDEIPNAVYWHEVAKKMEDYAKKNGYSVVETLVGHGIGREMHESPQVPNYVSQEMIRTENFKLVPGLVIAVEPMVNVGTKHTRVLSDHWTIITNDHKPSAHFEHTLAITASGVRVLTGAPETEEEKIDISPYQII
jgi:methionyl aminopeptidase